MNRKRVILAALLGILVLSLAYAYFAMPRLEKAPARTASQSARAAGKGTKTLQAQGGQARIDFGFLTVEPVDFPGARRDIFSFGRNRPVPTEAPVAVAEVPIAMPVMNAAVISEPAAVSFEVVQKSLSKFTFLGFLEKGGEKTVFLSSGGRVFLVKRGESFGVDQEFLVADIIENLLQVRHTGRDELVEIQLIEQQKLNASVSAPAKRAPSPGFTTSPGARNISPNRRAMRPAAPQDQEEPLPEIYEENRFEEEQEPNKAAEEPALEGEVNGTNK